MFLFQLAKDLFRSPEEGSRHSGHSGNVNAKAMGAASWRQFAEENYFITDFLIGDVIVVDACQLVLQLVEFVVMRGKEGLRLVRRLVEEFGDAPGDGNAVVCGGTSSDLIEQDQAACGEVVEDAGRFIHFHHKCRFTAAKVVGCADPGKDLIGEGDPGYVAGDEAADMRHKGDESGLPKEGAFAAHVGAGQDDDLLGGRVQQQVIGNIRFTGR